MSRWSTNIAQPSSQLLAHDVSFVTIIADAIAIIFLVARVDAVARVTRHHSAVVPLTEADWKNEVLISKLRFSELSLTRLPLLPSSLSPTILPSTGLPAFPKAALFHGDK